LPNLNGKLSTYLLGVELKKVVGILRHINHLRCRII
jgi:hypothetical protein